LEGLAEFGPAAPEVADPEVADLSLSPAANEAPGTARVQPSATAAAMQIFMSMVVTPFISIKITYNLLRKYTLPNVKKCVFKYVNKRSCKYDYGQERAEMSERGISAARRAQKLRVPTPDERRGGGVETRSS